MHIKDLQANQGKVDLVVEVMEKKEPRTFSKFGKEGKVCNAVVKDESGQVTLTLWNEDADKVNVGDKIHLQNGWCSEYNGELQVSAGKFGKLELVEAEQEGPKEVFTNDPSMMPPPSPSDSEEIESVDEEEFIE